MKRVVPEALPESVGPRALPARAESAAKAVPPVSEAQRVQVEQQVPGAQQAKVVLAATAEWQVSEARAVPVVRAVPEARAAPEARVVQVEKPAWAARTHLT